MRLSRYLCVFCVVGLAAPLALAQAQPAAKPAASPVAAAPAAAPKAADEKLPSGKDVLARFVEKTGGRAAYEKHTARVVTGTMEMPAMGMKAAYTLSQQAPSKFRMSMDMPGIGKIDQGSDGTTPWGSDPMNGPRVLPPEESEQIQRSMTFNAELEPEKVWKQIDTVALESVNGKPTYKVLLTPLAGNPTTNFYEVESGLLVKTLQTVKSPMGEVEVESTAADYKEFAGIKFATTTVQKQLGTELKTSVEKVEYPDKLADEVFAVPAEVKALLEKKAATPAAPLATPAATPPAPTPALEAKPSPKSEPAPAPKGR